MFSVAVVFAATTYSMSGSVGTTFVKTLLCIVLIQAGYFAMVVMMVARRKLAAPGPKTDTVQGSGVRDPR